MIQSPPSDASLMGNYYQEVFSVISCLHTLCICFWLFSMDPKGSLLLSKKRVNKSYLLCAVKREYNDEVKWKYLKYSRYIPDHPTWVDRHMSKITSYQRLDIECQGNWPVTEKSLQWIMLGIKFVFTFTVVWRKRDCRALCFGLQEKSVSKPICVQ